MKEIEYTEPKRYSYCIDTSLLSEEDDQKFWRMTVSLIGRAFREHRIVSFERMGQVSFCVTLQLRKDSPMENKEIQQILDTSSSKARMHVNNVEIREREKAFRRLKQLEEKDDLMMRIVPFATHPYMAVLTA